MLVGDLIAQFDDEATAAETILALGDLALVARIAKEAASQDLTPGEFVAAAVRRFAARASDEEWLTLVGKLARSDDPGRTFLRGVLAAAVASDRDAPAHHGQQALRHSF
jgi:hypothetical protein